MNVTQLDIECNYCKKIYTVKEVGVSDYQNWKNGQGFVQDLLPYLSAADRELIISNTCDSCWKEMWEVKSIDYEPEETEPIKSKKNRRNNK